MPDRREFYKSMGAAQACRRLWSTATPIGLTSASPQTGRAGLSTPFADLSTPDSPTGCGLSRGLALINPSQGIYTSQIASP
jgi:hypothetical protein